MEKTVFFLTVITLALMSCQKVVDADTLLDTDEQVSIIGYLSPTDTLLRISVSKALPSIGTPIKINGGNFAVPVEFLITNAIVTLSDDAGNSVQLDYSPGTTLYSANSSSLGIQNGREYFLRVQVDELEYNASCVIPEKVDNIMETINFTRDEFQQEFAAINVSFRDFEDVKNFYVVGGFFTATFQSEGQEPFNIDYALFFDTDRFLTDNLVNEGLITATAEVFVGNREEFTISALTVQVAHVDELLYQNLRAVDTNSDAEGNPFIEYAISPNTILDAGAVGVFAGYSLTEKIIEIE